MWDTHNKLQHGDNYNHWKILDLHLDFIYFYFFWPYAKPNPTQLPKHRT